MPLAESGTFTSDAPASAGYRWRTGAGIRRHRVSGQIRDPVADQRLRSVAVVVVEIGDQHRFAVATANARAAIPALLNMQKPMPRAVLRGDPAAARAQTRPSVSPPRARARSALRRRAECAFVRRLVNVGIAVVSISCSPTSSRSHSRFANSIYAGAWTSPTSPSVARRVSMRSSSSPRCANSRPPRVRDRPLEVRYSGEMPRERLVVRDEHRRYFFGARSGSARASQPVWTASWRPVLPSLSRPASRRVSRTASPPASIATTNPDVDLSDQLLHLAVTLRAGLRNARNRT